MEHLNGNKLGFKCELFTGWVDLSIGKWVPRKEGDGEASQYDGTMVWKKRNKALWHSFVRFPFKKW